MTLTNESGNKVPANTEVGYCKPPVHTRWKKGQSGNPSGRPKKIKEAEDILLEALTQAAKTMVGGLLSDDEKIRQAAAKEVIERSMGKAVQKVENKNVDDAKELDEAELANIATTSSQRTSETEESTSQSH